MILTFSNLLKISMNVIVVMEVVNMTVLIPREATTVLVMQDTHLIVIITTVLVCLLHDIA